MKKKTQYFRQDFKMPHLFREDLEKLEDIIKELSPQEYKFETKDFEYKTIQEITKDVEVINEINDFHIQTYNPYVSLDFNNNSAYIYSSDDDIKTIGVIKKITDIISKRERKLLWQLSRLSSFLAPALIWFPFLLMIFLSKETIKSNKILFVIATLILYIVAIVWWIIGYNAHFKKFSVIELEYKKNKSNFFIINKDRIIVGIIVAIVTVILTILSQKIFK